MSLKNLTHKKYNQNFYLPGYHSALVCSFHLPGHRKYQLNVIFKLYPEKLESSLHLILQKQQALKESFHNIDSLNKIVTKNRKSGCNNNRNKQRSIYFRLRHGLEQNCYDLCFLQIIAQRPPTHIHTHTHTARQTLPTSWSVGVISCECTHTLA